MGPRRIFLIEGMERVRARVAAICNKPCQSRCITAMAGLFGKSLVTTGSNASGVPLLAERAGPQGEREDSWMRTVLTDVTPAAISVRQLQSTRVVSLVLGEW